MGFFLWLVGNTAMVGFLLSRNLKKDLPIDSGGKQEPAGMITYRAPKSKRVEWIPDDVIVEILSRLPVKCVLRFKCVCKSWQIITLYSSFIQKHMSLSKSQTVYAEISKPTNGSKFIDYKNGLVLEQSEKTGKYRIRNPATKQVLQVLDDPEKQGSWKHIYIGFVSSTNICKLICMHGKKRTTEYGIKLLTVGTDLAWRPLSISHERPYERSSEDVYNIVNSDEAEVERTLIIRLNLKDESFMKIKIPQGFQTAGGSQMFSWDEKLSLGFIINKTLHVWVLLENHVNYTWSEKKIIPLKYIMDYPNANIVNVRRESKDQLDDIFNNNKLFYEFDSKKVLYIVKTPQDKKILYDLVPCLLSLKGMHSEDKSLLGVMRSTAAMIIRFSSQNIEGHLLMSGLLYLEYLLLRNLYNENLERQKKLFRDLTI